MVYTAGDVMNRTASALNDTAKTLYSYTVQLPYLKMAQQFLEQELNNNEVPLNLISEYEVNVTAGATSLSLPTNFFLPISLREKLSTSTLESDYSLMEEVSNVLDLGVVAANNSILQWWDYRHNCINFTGSSTTRKVRLFYWRQLSLVVDEGSIEPVLGADNYLAFKTAEYCARFIMANSTRADALRLESQGALDLLLSQLVKNNQGKRVRRRPFRGGGYSYR